MNSFHGWLILEFPPNNLRPRNDCLYWSWAVFIITLFPHWQNMEFYEQGNDFYKANDYQAAIVQYSMGINDHNISHDLKKKLLLNRAQSYLNLRDYTAAIHDCTMILDTLDDACPKALIRRALAYENCGNYRRGLIDIEKAMSLPGTALPTSLADTAMKLKTRLYGLAKADEIALIKEGRPDRMIHAHQTLRLNFNAEVPTEVNVEESFVVHLCIGNEFGLWNRSNMEIPSTTTAAAASSSSVASIVDPHIGGDNLVRAQVSLTRSLIDCDGTDICTLSVVQQTTAGGGGEDVVGLDGKVSLRLVFSFNHTDNTNTITNSTSSSTKPRPSEAIAVLKFSLNRCLPSGVDVVPVLTLPIRVRTCAGHGINIGPNSHHPFNHHPDSYAVNHHAVNHDSNDQHLLPHNPPSATTATTATKYHNLAHIGVSTHSSCIRECKIGLHDETLPSIFVLESPGSLGSDPQHTLSTHPIDIPITLPVNTVNISINTSLNTPPSNDTRPLSTLSQHVLFSHPLTHPLNPPHQPTPLTTLLNPLY